MAGTDEVTFTCYWCGKQDTEESELLIVHDDTSGICDRCVCYLMSILAIDLRSTFEQYVDIAREYSDNNAAARERRDAAKRLS